MMVSDLAAGFSISFANDNKMIVFSDLDGSLLDHDTYDWTAAAPALDMLRQRDIPLVLVSSKTLAEMQDYREQLELSHPIVAENGAAMHVPTGYFSQAAAFSMPTKTRAQLQAAYEAVKAEHEFDCEAFYELGIDGIIRETGLTQAQAQRSNDRAASEPILWRDSKAAEAAFESAMQARGLRCVRGGRFLHLMGDTEKGEAVRDLIAAYTREWLDKPVTSVSLGDGPNDLSMLAATDIGVVIPGKHQHSMQLIARNRILRPQSAGPTGWNEAMMQLLSE